MAADVGPMNPEIATADGAVGQADIGTARARIARWLTVVGLKVVARIERVEVVDEVLEHVLRLGSLRALRGFPGSCAPRPGAPAATPAVA